MPGFNSVASLYGGLNIPPIENGKQYHWPAVINAARAYLMPRFFVNATPQQVQDMTGLAAFYDQKSKQEVGEEVVDPFQRIWQNSCWRHLGIFQNGRSRPQPLPRPIPRLQLARPLQQRRRLETHFPWPRQTHGGCLGRRTRIRYKRE
jgi:hypothetical protein